MPAAATASASDAVTSGELRNSESADSNRCASLGGGAGRRDASHSLAFTRLEHFSYSGRNCGQRCMNLRAVGNSRLSEMRFSSAAASSKRCDLFEDHIGAKSAVLSNTVRDNGDQRVLS